MTIGSSGDRTQRTAHPPPAGCTRCGYATHSAAVYCRRCGAAQQPPTVSRAAPRLHGWEGLRRPTPLRLRRVRSATASARKALPPALSAERTLIPAQRAFLRFGAAGLLLLLAIHPRGVAILLIAFATLLYLWALLFRARTFLAALKHPGAITGDDEDARSLWDRTLPTYTVLVPAYDEPEVIGHLVKRLRQLEYPADRLDIKLLLEEDDGPTIAAAERAIGNAPIDIVRVPYSEPRTKPKALNIGLSLARGCPATGLVTIYDAEDQPDPLQLRRAVAAFRHLPHEVACLQAKLVFHNAGQNIITRWFTVEYAMWFSQLLPGLVRQGIPVPLGGTSNHFRRDVLEQLGGWDPHNVTEDADLGIRLHRAGYRTEMLNSITYEEANSDFVNWVKQRSRWYKGYMQTWLVHMRDPASLRRELGWRGFLGFNLFVAGTPLMSIINPVFWALTTMWLVVRPEFVQALFPSWIYYLSVVALVIGNFTFVYTAMVSARISGSPSLVWSAFLSPLYWLMMSVAGVKALIQLVHAPSFWEKTVHGLDSTVEGERREHAAA